MNDDITTETWFDQRPTHPTKPDFVLEAERKANEAWSAYYAAIDEPYTAYQSAREQMARVNALMHAAIDADEDKRYAYDQWMLAYEPSQRQEHYDAVLP